MKREGVIELLRRKFEQNRVPCSPDRRSDDEQA
jgi:hypothetical protein